MPAYTREPTVLFTATLSPVIADWLTVTPPSITSPSSGIILLVRRTILSPTFTLFAETKTSSPFLSFSHTFSTPSDIVFARSLTDFLWVHSSRISPILSKNITLEAVSKSPLISETVIATASRTETFSCPLASDFNAFNIYFIDLI